MEYAELEQIVVLRYENGGDRDDDLNDNIFHILGKFAGDIRDLNFNNDPNDKNPTRMQIEFSSIERKINFLQDLILCDILQGISIEIFPTI